MTTSIQSIVIQRRIVAGMKVVLGRALFTAAKGSSFSINKIPRKFKINQVS